MELHSILIREFSLILVLFHSDKLLISYLNVFFEKFFDIARCKDVVAFALSNDQITVLLRIPFICNCKGCSFEGDVDEVFFHCKFRDLCCN